MDVDVMLAELAKIGAVGRVPPPIEEEEDLEDVEEDSEAPEELRRRIGELYRSVSEVAEGLDLLAADALRTVQALEATQAAVQGLRDSFAELVASFGAPADLARAPFHRPVTVEPIPFGLPPGIQPDRSPESDQAYLEARERVRRKLLASDGVEPLEGVGPSAEEEEDIPYVGAVRVTASVSEEVSIRSLGTVAPFYPKEI